MKIIAILFLFFPLLLVAQLDTIVVFDIPSQTLQFIPIPPFDTLIESDYIPGFIGNWQDQIDLDLNFPDSTPPNSTFSNFEPAINHFDMLKYPIRTNVAILWLDSIFEQHASCSGTLISENIVLTATHCMGNYDNNEFIWKIWNNEGLYVSPSHSGGFPQPSIGKIKVEKYAILKEYYDHGDANVCRDIGLLILSEPIGRDIGWLGYGFNYDSMFYKQPIFYNFSYPGRDGYDGEDMYYFYGSFNYFNFSQGFVGHGGFATNGMSGSNFFFSNNEINISYGELIYPNRYKIIRRENFYAIKHIVQMFEVGIFEGGTNNNEILVYPNPMSETSIIEVRNPALLKDKLTFSLYNSLGSECLKFVNIKQSKTLLKRENLKPGIYFFIVLDGAEMIANGKIIML